MVEARFALSAMREKGGVCHNSTRPGTNKILTDSVAAMLDAECMSSTDSALNAALVFLIGCIAPE